MASGLPPWIGFLALALAAAALAGAWWTYRHVRAIRDTPTSKTRSIAVGPVELVGTAEAPPSGTLLEAPFSGTPCLGYSWSVEEQRTRTVTSRDAKGRTTTRTETYWATLASGQELPPFSLRDSTGSALVDPRGGSPPTKRTYTDRSGTFDDPTPRVIAFLALRGIQHEGWFGMNRTLRFNEHALLPGTPLYVLGTAVPRPDAPADALGTDALVVQAEGRVPFLLVEGSEASIVRNRSLGAGALLLLGLALAGVGAYLLTTA